MVHDDRPTRTETGIVVTPEMIKAANNILLSHDISDELVVKLYTEMRVREPSAPTPVPYGRFDSPEF